MHGSYTRAPEHNQFRHHAIIEQLHTMKVEVGLVLLIQNGRRDIRHITSSIGLASDIDLVVLDAEGSLEVFQEANEFVRDLFLARCSRCSDGVSNSNGMFDPARVSQCPSQRQD
jgi:hypothetical protein